MILNEFIKTLLKLQEEGHGDKPLIYSVDDEGNDYHKIHQLPCLCQVRDINEHNLEVVGFIDTEDNINIADCNCIIVN